MNIPYTNTFRDLLAFQRYHQNGSHACQRRPARQPIEAMMTTREQLIRGIETLLRRSSE